MRRNWKKATTTCVFLATNMLYQTANAAEDICNSELSYFYSNSKSEVSLENGLIAFSSSAKLPPDGAHVSIYDQTARPIPRTKGGRDLVSEVEIKGEEVGTITCGDIFSDASLIDSCAFYAIHELDNFIDAGASRRFLVSLSGSCLNGR